jgi:hypothetical protein
MSFQQAFKSEEASEVPMTVQVNAKDNNDLVDFYHIEDKESEAESSEAEDLPTCFQNK